MGKVKDSLKYIKLKDILAIFIFLIMVIPALIFKLINKIKKKHLWLICENKDTARDNGYHLFKYIRINYPNDYTYYAINKKSSDYNKIKEYGNIIEFGSLKHWLYYLAADYNISNQKYGNPNPPLFYVLHIYLNLFNNRIFLQHGITKDDSKWIYYNQTKFKLFICGAKAEYDYIKDNFGYPNKNLKYLGFPRFDNLFDNNIKRQILVMPTWRNWLSRDTNILKNNIDFKTTEYYKTWNSFLNNDELQNILKINNIDLYFYPHINMSKYLKYFNTNSDHIKIVNNENIDIQTLLKESSLLITDYSSVYMDFAYMNKPLIYYQFDILEYREKQLQKGYFDYDKDGFGDVIITEDKAIESIKKYVDNNFEMENIYLNRSNSFFELKDKNNSKRVYEAIKELR